MLSLAQAASHHLPDQQQVALPPNPDAHEVEENECSKLTAVQACLWLEGSETLLINIT